MPSAARLPQFCRLLAPGIEDLGPGHWSVRLVRATGFVFGTVVPRYIPLGEEAMFQAPTFGIRRALARRGTPTGHGAGTGKEIEPEKLAPAAPASRL